MNLKNVTIFSSVLPLLLSVGCLRSYNVSPLNNVSLSTTLKNESGLTLKTKAFLTRAEVMEKFGEKLADDRQVVPVQVLIINSGVDSFKVLRTSFVLLASGGNTRLAGLNNEELYQLGRHGYGKPVCGMVFGGVLGLPSLITTIRANERLREDYERKLLQDAIVDPGKEITGAVFFNPESANLKRNDSYKLVVELENTKTNVKVVLEQPLV